MGDLAHDGGEAAQGFIRVADSASLPARAAGLRFAVPDFDLAEQLIARGADSAQVAVVPAEAAAVWGAHEAFVPARPYAFGWRTLLVLPTYNEAENLADVAAASHRYLETDILVVDDNSSDGTKQLADELASRDARIQVLHRPGREGLGRAYLAGFEWALARGYERILEMDCDFSHSPWDLPRLVHASGSADLVIGSRYVRGGGTSGWSFGRRMLSQGGNLYTSFFLGGGVHDWTAGFRCFTGDLLRRVDLARVDTNGYAFQIEMAWATQRAGGSVREIPIRFVDRRKGQSKMTRAIALEAIRVVPRLRRKH